MPNNKQFIDTRINYKACARFDTSELVQALSPENTITQEMAKSTEYHYQKAIEYYRELWERFMNGFAYCYPKTIDMFVEIGRFNHAAIYTSDDIFDALIESVIECDYLDDDEKEHRAEEINVLRRAYKRL